MHKYCITLLVTRDLEQNQPMANCSLQFTKFKAKHGIFMLLLFFKNQLAVIHSLGTILLNINVRKHAYKIILGCFAL